MTEQKWHGPDKNWNGSNSFNKETVNFYPFRNGSIGAYGPVAERIKVHCFFVKTVGTVPVFVGPVPVLLCRVNAPLVDKLAWETMQKDTCIEFFVSLNSISLFQTSVPKGTRT